MRDLDSNSRGLNFETSILRRVGGVWETQDLEFKISIHTLLWIGSAATTWPKVSRSQF
jgi:hypothetical protein